jgi:hypothetical protein
MDCYLRSARVHDFIQSPMCYNFPGDVIHNE